MTEEKQKDTKWFYWLAAGYIFISYTFILLSVLGMADIGEPGIEDNTMLFRFLWGTIAKFFPLLYGLLNLILLKKNRNVISRNQLLNCTILIKYSLIPLFALGGVLILLFALMSFIPVPFMIFVGPTAVIALNLYGFEILIGSAPFSISYLKKSRQEGVHGKAFTIIAEIMQFFFTLDVVSIMILSFKEKRWRKLTVCVLLALVLIFIGTIAYWGIGIMRGY